MAYYQILRQRRRDLKLSIEDVSSQTRLAPQYIQAIEDNNLDIFLDDFDFVRNFVHGYAEAIGVNWEMIKDEVDLNIDQYARIKSMTYTQAQRALAAMPVLEEPENEPTFQPVSKPVQKKTSQNKKTNSKKKKNTRKNVEKKVSKTAKKAYKWSKKSARNFAIAVVALVVAGLVVTNLILNHISNSQDAAAEAEKEAELKAKEEETTKLANQKKQTSGTSDSSDSSDSSSSKDIQIENTDYENNIFTITNLVEGDQKLTIHITIPNYTTIAVYQDDTAINDTSVTYMDSYEQTFSIDHACVIQLEIENWEDNEILVNGQTVTFNSVYWYEGQPAVLYFEIKDSSSDSTSDTSKITTNDTTTTTSTDDTDTSDETEESE